MSAKRAFAMRGVLVKLAVVGSRDFPYEWMVHGILNQWLHHHREFLHIVSGGARGVDSWAEEWAIGSSVPRTIFKPDWNTHGKVAGFMRNQDIVGYADAVIAFSYRDSKGTAHSIGLAERAGKMSEVITVGR